MNGRKRYSPEHPSKENLVPSQEKPLYQQIYDDIKDAINEGVYPPESKIPTETELSETYSVSRITIRRAIEDLSNAGYLVKRRGLGTFVCAPRMRRNVLRGKAPKSFTDICRESGHVPSARLIKKEIVPPRPDECEFFGIDENELVIHIQRVRMADGLPIFEENMFLPYRDAKELYAMDLKGESIYQAFDSLYGRTPVKQARMTIQSIGASTAKAGVLQIPVGEPLLHTTTYAVDQFDKPIYIGRQYYVGSRYMLDL